MKKTIAILIAMTALSGAAVAGRSDYPSFSDIVPKDLKSSAQHTRALAVPAPKAGKLRVDRNSTDHGLNSR